MSRNNAAYRPCVGVVLINAQGLIFAAKRLDFQSDAWQMPQGGVDDGEDLETAALRELAEETGVSSVEILGRTEDWLYYDLPDELMGKLWGGKFHGQRQIWFAMRFTGEDDQINIDQPNPEFSEWKWMRPADVIEKIVPFKRNIYQEVLAHFEKFTQ